MSTPRNAPCPCGSGRKHKLCCGPKERAREEAARASGVAYGPCEAPAAAAGMSCGQVQCAQPGRGAHICKLCGQTYTRCHAHRDAILTMLNGHVLRVHPEAVPDAVRKLLRSNAQLATIEAEAQRNPEMWAKLLSEIEKVRNAEAN